MKRQQYSITINAPVQKVWDTMLQDKTYREWTAVFNKGGSYFEGSWEKGSKIKFIGPDEQGNLGGMSSIIADNQPLKFISIKHMGIIHNGVEDTTSDEVKGWVGALENYTFTDLGNGQTKIDVDIDVDDSMVKEFDEMWPKSLQKLKEIAEK